MFYVPLEVKIFFNPQSVMQYQGQKGQDEGKIHLEELQKQGNLKAGITQ